VSVVKLTITTSSGPDGTVVWVGGNLDVSTVSELEAAVRAALDERQDVVLDVHEVRVCDSTGLGTLVRLHRSARSLGRALTLRNPRGSMAEVLARTGIEKVVPVIGGGPGG
jgi:anti-sigma B factor antagonist